MFEIASIVGLVGTATSSIVGATEAGKNLKDIFGRPEVDIAASKQLVLDLLEKLIDAKQAQMEIRDLVMTLQSELKERDQFETDLARYSLTKTDRGATVYRLKEGDPSGEPIHHLCPYCAAKRTKSFLQPAPHRANCLYCTPCKTDFPMSLGDGADFLSAPGRSTR